MPFALAISNKLSEVAVEIDPGFTELLLLLLSSCVTDLLQSCESILEAFERLFLHPEVIALFLKIILFFFKLQSLLVKLVLD